ncbi:uncharacterized protein RHOBADRAFT_55178 [Rhodotorula graminis WP1]|uniref:Proteophosphoglycan ppg4 n=1 Tax=Rhodotorula graminis (strain WP1) TaxID=578459 RepID=A0A0P9GJY5_RHOGW|nr:uncharacterized protein RHOBADRAFT_55178 [Rhodotorula graminis WP1]KPV73440.1 hypothetical protein RHOBADRAFT_55178 [Rhodotorula graminis WP1]
MGRHDTRMVLAIALAVPVFRAAAAAAFLRRPVTLSALATSDKRKWAVAVCEVVRTFSQVAASRLNPVWVWASTDLFIPLLLLAFPATPATDAPRTTRLYAAVAVASFATAWTWCSDLLNAEGMFLALVSVGAETMGQWLARQELDEASGRVDEAVEAVRDSSLRAAALHVVMYLALFPLDLHQYRAYSQGPAIASSIIWPFLALFASVAFIVVEQDGKLDVLSSIAIYSASNAVVLVLVAAPEWSNTASRTVGGLLVVLYLANVAYQLISTRIEGISLSLEPGSAADYDPLASSPASKILSTRLGPPSMRIMALVPALAYLSGALCVALAASPTLDIVIAHHSRAPASVAHHVAAVRLAPHVRKSRVRVYLYEKGDWTDQELWRGLSGVLDPRWDEIVRLPNVGREGGTYLEHVVRHYNASLPSPSTRSGASRSSWATRVGRGGEARVRPFADTTLFLQDHLAWPGVAGPRLRHTLSSRTGFLSLGPYLSNLCGHDSEVGTEMGGIKDIFETVKARQCTEGNEDDRVLSTWFGQFAASRATLLKNGLEVYERLVRMVEAPDDDPIHKQYNPSGPSTASNPAFGHALERSWPLLLHCDDRRIAETCRNGAWEPRDCQCFEET